MRATVAEVHRQGVARIQLGPCLCVGVNGQEFGNARHPTGRDHERQSQIWNLSALGKRAFLHERRACDINVVTAPTKGRLGDAILQHHDRPSAIDDDRTLAAKVVQGTGIEGIKMRR
jgi:hypothetical protein